ncbi:hypothetical protein SCUCBS95973_009225 [Sporothrix curviconia]|uniref:Uncharacterized protein n=1 Tax=Sporothrix curviconia TaxID=1260050 RepID=A0ABP0CT55_9PEZI
MPVSAKDGISALCSADNCSTADTSFGDRTLASFTGNAPSISSLPPLDKHADRETSPKPKHRVVSADVAAIENWRPNVSTIKEKSTDSAGSAVDQQPYHPKEPEAKSLAKPRRRPEASLDCHSVAIAEARHIENSAREVSASSFTTDPDGCYSPLLAPLEKEPKGKAAETPRLSLFHTSRPRFNPS